MGTTIVIKDPCETPQLQKYVLALPKERVLSIAYDYEFAEAQYESLSHKMQLFFYLHGNIVDDAFSRYIVSFKQLSTYIIDDPYDLVVIENVDKILPLILAADFTKSNPKTWNIVAAHSVISTAKTLLITTPEITDDTHRLLQVCRRQGITHIL